jgi:hypothetical protein
MKKLRNPAAAALASYLLGCFWAADFNIATWTGEMRFVIMVTMGLSGIFALVATEVSA